MNKKAITILGAIFLLIVGTLGFLIYQRRSSGEETNTNTNTNTQPLPPSDDITPTPPVEPPPTEPAPPVDPTPLPPSTSTMLRPVQLLQDNPVSPVLFYRGNGIAYFNSRGQLFQADLDFSNTAPKLTNTRELGVPPKSGISKIHWPMAGDNYLAESVDSTGKKSWSVYVSSKGAYVDVPKEVTAVNWMPDGEQVLYLWTSGGKTNLNLSPVDFSTWQVITDIWENDDDIAIAPDGRTILFWRTGNTEAINKINMVTPDGKLFRTVVKDGYNIGVAWSPDSQKFVFNRRGQNGTLGLWVSNLFTGESKNLNVEGAVAAVAWASDSSALYVPIAAGSGKQKLVKVNVASGTAQSMDLDGNVEMAGMFMSADGKGLFFKNNLDGALYYVDVSAAFPAS